MGLLARLPLGPALIDFLGHMRAEAGVVGLSAVLDPEGQAAAALSRFGVGFIELGPVAMVAPSEEPSWQLDGATRTLKQRRAWVVGAPVVLERLRRSGERIAVPVWIRISSREPAPRAVDSAFAEHTRRFALEAGDDATEAQIAQRVQDALSHPLPTPARVALSLRADQPNAVALARSAVAAGADTIWIRAERIDQDGAIIYSDPAMGSAVIEQARALRAALPASTELIAGGVLSPDDVKQRLAAGAQLTTTDAGLVFSGPGLIKRCNEALLLHEQIDDAASHARTPLPSFSLDAARGAWLWCFVLGLAMFFGGLLALGLASTRVVLPYDEALCGMNRAQLAAVNPRLLPFMAHDRVSLAASMLSIGILYAALAYHGIRRGSHWAHVAVVSSALVGFFSFFLFLGFGYFDPFHAFVSAVLLQLVLLSMALPRGADRPIARPEWLESAAWRRAQWGQLMFVVMGAGLIGAGTLITVIGCTDVFVREDLAFLRTTAAELLVAHERLVPLVAHDRASLGGMLLANGIAVLCSALWGFRAGARWLWSALAWAGNVAFALAIGVHFVVGYDSVVHLAPAFAGWAIWCLALTLTREHTAKA